MMKIGVDNMDRPPFDINIKMLQLTILITEKIGKINSFK